MPSPKKAKAAATCRPIKHTLRKVFNLEAFRPGQEVVIDSILAGRNTLAIMPTGAGTSLCYQLPALHLPGMTLVVSPLISLMKDQVDKLDVLGVDASQVNSALSSDEESAALHGIEDQRPEFILTTPERVSDAGFLASLDGKAIDLFVIDEAHCISQWGHDFRPSYLDLARAIERVGRPPVLALTATASAQVAADIVRQLQLKDANIISTGTYRPNLRYEVEAVETDDDRNAVLLRVLAETRGTGIVYTSTVKHTESLTTFLRSAGVAVARYHGRLPAKERHDTQERFMRDELRVIVATNAFGMGIDKPDLRFVVHYNMPGSLDSYYQESVAPAAMARRRAACCSISAATSERTCFSWPAATRASTTSPRCTSARAWRAHEAPAALEAIQADAVGVAAKSKVRGC